MEIFCLQGKKAFVSGASRGLGREMALALAEAGADVALAARGIEDLNETAALINKMGRAALVCSMDITKLAEIEKAVTDAIDAFGQLDILINNSGIAGETPVAEMSPEKWDSVMEVNLKGHVFRTKAVGQHMIKKRHGKIINMASIGGIMPIPYSSAYCVAKAGLVLFTKTLALEWARYNIQVNALCPGYFLTDLNRDFFKSSAGQKVLKKIPMRRLAQTKEIRGVTLLLASDALSFMTGSVVIIDGGHTLG